MREELLLLIIAAMVAGCTTALPEDGDTAAESGIDISASVTDSAIFADGGSTNLIVDITSNHHHSLEDVSISIANSRGLNVEGVTCTEGEVFTVGASQFGAPVTKHCVWRIEKGRASIPETADELRIPLTVFVTYESVVSPRTESLKVSFESGGEISPGEDDKQAVRADNGDLSVRASHESPVSADSGKVPLRLEVENTGPGTLQSLFRPPETREVRVSYGGSLPVRQVNMETTTCVDGDGGKTLNFIQGKQRASFECQFALTAQDLERTTFTLRPEVAYRYRLAMETPVTLVERN